MRKFREMPVVEATQITDATFDAPDLNPEHMRGLLYDSDQRCVFIPIPGGTMRADVGDWIIRDAKGDVYPCKYDVFKDTHEPEADR